MDLTKHACGWTALVFGLFACDRVVELPLTETETGTASPPSCTDSEKNGQETGKDCGGPCSPCADGEPCLTGDDCTSLVCEGGTCIQATCLDGKKNGAETDEDCGGDTCGPCGSGSPCNEADDCLSGVCQNGTCLSPTCSDLAKNGDETGTDCGGSCPGCPDGGPCVEPSDCISLVCLAGICAPPSCEDTIKNGSESDVDCGGSCSPCKGGQLCDLDADCESDSCAGTTCAFTLHFVPGMGYSTSANPVPLALRDVDKNGTLDALVFGSAYPSATIFFHSGNGDGTFAAPVDAGGPGNKSNSAVVVEDLNHDGELDVAIAEYTYGQNSAAWAYAGSGSGQFPTTLSSFVAWGGTTAVSNIASGSFDIDDSPDLAVTLIDLGSVGVLGNDGAGHFSLKKQLTVGDAQSRPQSVAAGDFNSDGLMDIAAGNTGNGLVNVFCRTGDYQFAPPLPHPALGWVIDLDSTDINGDGFLDLVAADCLTGAAIPCTGAGISGARVFLGNGDCTFQPAILAGAGNGAVNVVTDDFNLDGRLDVAYANAYLPPVGVALGEGNGQFQAPVELSYAAAANARWVASGDLNGDAKPDLVVVDFTTSVLQVFLNASY